jgi:hypothetical protein
LVSRFVALGFSWINKKKKKKNYESYIKAEPFESHSAKLTRAKQSSVVFRHFQPCGNRRGCDRRELRLSATLRVPSFPRLGVREQP